MSFRIRHLFFIIFLFIVTLTMFSCTGSSSRITVDNSWLEISESALDSNTKKVIALLDNKASLCAVLKGDAYGHDLSLVAPVMIKNNVPCIGVASNQELKTVRDLGFKKTLMRVRNATEEEMREALNYNVEELIGDLKSAQKLNELAKNGGKSVSFHLALNSGGMSRNGIEVKSPGAIEEINDILKLSNLKIVGIMSHYPEEDEAQVKIDLARFKKQVDQILSATGIARDQIKVHMANTFATLTVPESWLDMVRVGGIFYADTIAKNDYQRVMTYKSKIAALHRYPKGNTVGYDRTYTLTRDSLLANIPLGYSDGYRRVFSNKGTVLIQGKRVPVLGKTSMNTIIVDVTDLANVSSGDEVVIFGKQGSEEIKAEEIENISDALFTEMSILWGATNKRILVV